MVRIDHRIRSLDLADVRDGQSNPELVLDAGEPGIVPPKERRSQRHLDGDDLEVLFEFGGYAPGAGLFERRIVTRTTIASTVRACSRVAMRNCQPMPGSLGMSG